MAKQILYVLFLFLLSTTMELTTASSAAPAGTSKRAVNFIQASCKSTTYPTVCFSSLSGYANSIQTSPQRLAETALTVTVNQAQSTKVFVSRLARFKGLKKREVSSGSLAVPCNCTHIFLLDGFWDTTEPERDTDFLLKAEGSTSKRGRVMFWAMEDLPAGAFFFGEARSRLE
ncbi:hypothetical protein DY000_02036360 [Brassica cretica]|uniref:Pectinesterase inhibitor domain-containing protein n=1 Tax=Brassica cretica TaxID=69181 RepID=A0ABQ7BH83_BRACR|nr:hypothetical protein DY000_02036360 [Brassica cretica]